MEKTNSPMPNVAYFSMEIGISPDLPTYSGGLGVLAGDTLRAGADLGLPMVAMTLLYRKGYFRQSLDAKGVQSVNAVSWTPEKFLEPLDVRTSITIEGRTIHIRPWRYVVNGVQGQTLPIYFLDTELPENSDWDRNLSGALYNRDDHFRLCQEAILGIGGVAMLERLGYDKIDVYHMNEGHSSLLTLALLDKCSKGIANATIADRDAIRQKCVFTTHTPVPAGHDRFSKELICQVLGNDYWEAAVRMGCSLDHELNMTNLALTFSRYINGVAMRHGEVSQDMFPNYPVSSITNGIHTVSWTAPAFSTLFDRHIPEWRRDNFYLRHAINIPLDDIRKSHQQAKESLLAVVATKTGLVLDPTTFTIGYARRMTAYKRPDLLFSNIDRLKQIAHTVGPIQIIYAGKAHPRDDAGRQLIQQVYQAAEKLKDTISVVYLEDYDMSLGRKLCAGVDVWLNTPKRPQEASGTSGMKAATNGVPSLSILDGWWIEGHTEGVTGWSIGTDWKADENSAEDVESLYSKLEKVVIPLYYKSPREFDKIRQATIALNGSFFNTQRMMLQYLRNAYVSI